MITANPKPLPGISYVPLFSYESVLAVSNQHPLTQKPYLEASDLADQTLICYPVDKDMLDIFVQFLDPAEVEPAAIRHAELTVMMMQLVASGRGVCALPNWALDEYTSRGYVTAKSMSQTGIWCTLYAAVRNDQTKAKYMMDFLTTARETSAATLVGVKQVDQQGAPLKAPEDCL